MSIATWNWRRRGYQPSTLSTVLGRHRDRLALLALGVLMVLVVSPVGNFPLDDDWWYARPVQRLVADGTLRLIPGTGPSLVAQVVWGALFVEIFGFSHTVLRASTLVLAVLGVLAFHDLASRALGRRLGLLLAALLMVNPLFVTTAYSFRTDVPFLAVALLALAAATRGLDGPSPRLGWLIAAGVLAGTSYLIRQFGIVLPPAMLAAVGVAFGWRVAVRPRVLLPILVPAILAIGFWQIWRRMTLEAVATSELEVFAFLADNDWSVLLARFLTWFRPTMVYLGLIGLPLSAPFVLSSARLAGRVRVGIVIGGLGVWWMLVAHWAGDVRHGAYLIPICLAILAPWPARRAIDVPVRAGLMIVAAVIAADTVTHLSIVRAILPTPLLGFTLTPSGFQTNTMFWREPPPPLVSDATRAAVSGLGLIGVPLLLAAATRAVGRGTRHPATIGTLVFGALVLAEVLLLSFFRGVQDRYLLALVPSTLLLGAVTAPRTRLLLPLGIVSVVLLGAWSVSWQREYMARQQAIWSAAEALVAQGARARYVDGGYEWNGWYRESVAVERGRQRARRRSPSDYLNGVYLELSRSDMPWYVDFRPDPGATCANHVVTIVPYLDDRLVYGLRRCR